jgi:hypothetical protein
MPADAKSGQIILNYFLVMNNRPHPGLLPRGEGETFPAFCKYQRRDWSDDLSNSQEATLAAPSPWGEGGVREDNSIHCSRERRRRGIFVVKDHPRKPSSVGATYSEVGSSRCDDRTAQRAVPT